MIDFFYPTLMDQKCYLGRGTHRLHRWYSCNRFDQISVRTNQSVTSRSQEFPFPGIVLFFSIVSEPVSEKSGTEKSIGISIEKICYRKKVSEPVLEKFDTGTNFRPQNLEIMKIYNVWPSRFFVTDGHSSCSSRRNWLF